MSQGPSLDSHKAEEEPAPVQVAQPAEDDSWMDEPPNEVGPPKGKKGGKGKAKDGNKKGHAYIGPRLQVCW